MIQALQVDPTRQGESLFTVLSEALLRALLSDEVQNKGAVEPAGELHAALLAWERGSDDFMTRAILSQGEGVAFVPPSRSYSADLMVEYRPELLIPDTELVAGRDLERWAQTDLHLRGALHRSPEARTGETLEAWYRLLHALGLHTGLQTGLRLTIHEDIAAFGRAEVVFARPPLAPWADRHFDFAAYGHWMLECHDSRTVFTLSSRRLATFG